jgi:hypothetical protein
VRSRADAPSQNSTIGRPRSHLASHQRLQKPYRSPPPFAPHCTNPTLPSVSPPAAASCSSRLLPQTLASRPLPGASFRLPATPLRRAAPTLQPAADAASLDRNPPSPAPTRRRGHRPRVDGAAVEIQGKKIMNEHLICMLCWSADPSWMLRSTSSLHQICSFF